MGGLFVFLQWVNPSVKSVNRLYTNIFAFIFCGLWVKVEAGSGAILPKRCEAEILGGEVAGFCAE